MTTSTRAATDRPAAYRGEPAERRPALAFLLTLLCPGLGAMYLGSLHNGILISLTYASAVGLFVVAWTDWKFFPILPAAMVLLIGFIVTLILAVRAARAARAIGTEYTKKNVNHPLIYLIATFCFYVAPLVLTIQFTAENLWMTVVVEGDSMFPTLVDGDVLLVDRTGFRGAAPQPGELVAVRTNRPGRAPLLARVIGVPGDEISFQDMVPVIDDVYLARLPIAGADSEVEARYATILEMAPDRYVTFAERNRGVSYLTSEQERGTNEFMSSVELNGGEYFLVHDNREQPEDSRLFGPISPDQIMGRPLHILWSMDRESAVRWWRLATRVQPGI